MGLIPLDDVKFKKTEWRFLQILENGGSRDIEQRVEMQTGVTVKETESNTVTSKISAEMKKGAYTFKAELGYEWAHAIETTSEKKLIQSIDLTVPPHSKLKVYQGIVCVSVGNFPVDFGLLSWKTEEEKLV